MVPQDIVRGYIRSVSTKPFIWGEQDCLQLAGGLVGAVDGHNPAAKYKGTYDCEFSAAKILWREYGGRLAEALHYHLKPARKPKFGYIALVRVFDREAAGIVQDRSVLVLHEGKGLIALPHSAIVRVYQPICRK